MVLSRDRTASQFPAANRGTVPGDLESGDLLSLGALGALADLELDLLVLLEGTEAVALDLGVVDEDVVAAIVRSDEAVALFGVEPLDNSLCHVLSLLTFSVIDALPTLRRNTGPMLEPPGWLVRPHANNSRERFTYCLRVKP